MNQTECKQILDGYILKYGKNPRAMRNLRKDHSEWIDVVKTLFPEVEDLSTKIYWLLNGIFEFPKCKVCGTEIRKKCQSWLVGYNEIPNRYKFCSTKCACKTEEWKESHKSINSPEAIEKRKQTCLEKYGGIAPSCNKNVVDKVKQTKLERYGDSGYHNMEKAKATCLEKYGVENVSQIESIKKLKSTTGFNSPGVRERAIETLKIKYGVSNPMQNKEIAARSRASMMKRMPELKIKRAEDHKLRKYNRFCESPIKPLFNVDEYDPRLEGSQILKWHCDKCGTEFESPINNNWGWGKDRGFARCPKCDPIMINSSNEEREIRSFIESLVGQDDVISNSRNIILNRELDIYIPSKKIAIEFDGLYWHSTNQTKWPKKHLEKTELCEKLGIQLIHIFENEWKNKNEIVKSRLRSMLGCSEHHIGARKCILKEVSSNEAKQFLNDNHIQGWAPAKVNIGLVYENELVSLMTFSKPRFNKKFEWELLRFANKCGWNVSGGASKCLKYFEKTYKPESIISYADRRWSKGNLYCKLGFNLINVSEPNYWYIIDGDLQNRIKFQKHKLPTLLPIFDESKTEIENMEANGIFRIFDCGNLVFEKRLTGK